MIREIFKNQNNLEKIAVIENEKYITRKELIEKAILVSKYIENNNSKNIAIFLDNGVDFISAFLGIFICGKVSLPMNPLMKYEEIMYLIEFCEIEMIISSIKYRDVLDNINSKYKNINILYMEELIEINSNFIPFIDNTSIDNIMTLITTSGTTGNPKIVELSERNIATVVIGFSNKINLSQEPVQNLKLILSTPFYTSYGIMVILVCLLNEVPIVIMNGAFTLDKFYKTVEKYRVTHYEGGPILTTLMEETIGKEIKYDIDSLKYIAFGGSKVSGETIRKLLRAYPKIKFWQGYGMSEASPLISKPSIRLKDIESYHKKLDSVGDVIDNVKVYILDNGHITDKPNILGEILVKGSNVMKGYYKNPEETNKVLKDGYLYTGDIGYIDEDNYLYIKGRKKNLIIVRGINVYPEEVELCIINSGLAKDCYVYGMVSEFSNEIVCAKIIPTNEFVKENNIREYLSEKLSDIKHPKKIEFVDFIERGSTGKILRR